MGGWSVRIGGFTASQMDYYYDHIKTESMPIHYYENETVDIKVTYLELGNQEKIFNVPLKELHYFEKNEENGLYNLRTSDDEPLFKWLFNKIVSSGTKIETYIKLNLHNSRMDYYLNSSLLDDNIIITTKKVKHEIKTLEEFKWLEGKGFYQSIK